MESRILDELNEIDWGNFMYPDVPIWVRNLASDDLEARNVAYNNLEKILAYAGSTSWENYGPLSELLKTDMPIVVVPFLITLLNYEGVRDKEYILELLLDIATYRTLIKEDDEEVYKDRAHRAYNAVQKGIDIYGLLSSDHDPNIRMVASSLLDEFKMI
ncbi:MAG: hypothetical protein R3E39_32150 [Anaerolineae bacterium]